jgi:hypothetical protein
MTGLALGGTALGDCPLRYPASVETHSRNRSAVAIGLDERSGCGAAAFQRARQSHFVGVLQVAANR